MDLLMLLRIKRHSVMLFSTDVDIRYRYRAKTLKIRTDLRQNITEGLIEDEQKGSDFLCSICDSWLRLKLHCQFKIKCQSVFFLICQIN